MFSLFMALIKGLSALLRQPIGYGVYIHWPYCVQLCTYCNFNKYRQPHQLDQEKLCKFFVKELETLLTKADFPIVTSVYFGGGTPSLAPPTTVQAIMKCIRDVVGLSDGAEVTLEVNPTLDMMVKLKQFKSVGVNRISIGIQSLNDHMLSAIMSRDHVTTDSLNVLKKACLLFPRQVNADLMFGLPGQDLDEWVEHLTQIASHQTGHLSLYQLTLERGTPLAKAVGKGDLTLPHEHIMLSMYSTAIKRLHSEGFTQYEVSNFAQPGSESLHNLNYWLGGNYIGIGPGAHSRYLKPHTQTWVSSINALTPQQWMGVVNKKGHGNKDIKEMTYKERFEEIVATSLRTSYGLLMIHCESFGVSYNNFVKQLHNDHSFLFTNGLLCASDDSLKATPTGLQVLDTILANMLATMETVQIEECY